MIVCINFEEIYMTTLLTFVGGLVVGGFATALVPKVLSFFKRQAVSVENKAGNVLETVKKDAANTVSKL